MSDDRDAFPTDIRGYHARTKHSPGRYALGPAFLDWTLQPSPYRRFAGAPTFALPLRDLAPTPDFPGPAAAFAPLDADALGLFFELAFGLSAWKSIEGASWALRNNPSSGNLHPTEAYALLDAGAGCGDRAALWHYAPLGHALEERARYAAEGVLPPGGFLLGLSSIPWREAWKYGERAFRYCQLDVGHAIGAAAQAAAALGWRAVALPEPGDAQVAALLGLDRPDACHRREEEHPDALMWIATDGGGAPPLDLDALLAQPRVFAGVANRLSEEHDGWPVVDLAARFCRKSRTAAPSPAPLLPPSPRLKRSIGDVVRGRRSAQRMDGRATLPRAAFARMLRATLPGAPPLLDAFPWPARLALLLFVHRVESVPAGIYLLPRTAIAETDALPRLRAAIADAAWTPCKVDGLPLLRLRDGSFEREATKLSCLQPIAGKGCFSLAMLVDFDRALAEEGGFAYRRLHWEAGLVGQALYLEAEAAGLAGTGIGCFFDDEAHALLGLPRDGTQFQDVYHFTVGAPVEDARLLTLPAYPDETRAWPRETDRPPGENAGG